MMFHKLSSPISPHLVGQVYELASKLKYHDPHFAQGQGEPEELGDPAWLLDLRSMCNYVSEFTQLSDCDGNQNLSTNTVNEEFHLTSQITGPSVAEQSTVMSTDLQNSNIQSFQGYTWGNQEGVTALDQASSVQDLNLHQMTNGQYNYNYSNHMQWNLESTQQPEHKLDQLNSTDGGTIEFTPPPPPPSSVTDYYGATAGTQQVQASNSLLTRERADSSTGSTRWDRKDSVQSNQSGSFQPSLKQPPPPSLQSQSLKKSSVEGSKKIEGKDDKAKTQVGRSWLGGIFSKFLPKAPNQMILPDDKNPAIVWDSVKNRWINTDEDEDDENGKPIAPPKDSELTKFSSDELPPIGFSSSVGQNRFQKPKVRGMRQNYVDVLNPGSTMAKVPEVPVLNKTENAPSPDLFVPQPAGYSPENVQDFMLQSQSSAIPPPPLPPDNAPQMGKVPEATNLSPMMFDPAEFATRSGSNMKAPGMGRLARRAFIT